MGAYGYDNFNGKQSYYLSNTKDSIFDSKKIGKSEDGIYLIGELAGGAKVQHMKIAEINDSQIKFEVVTFNKERKILIYNAVK